MVTGSVVVFRACWEGTSGDAVFNRYVDCRDFVPAAFYFICGLYPCRDRGLGSG